MSFAFEAVTIVGIVSLVVMSGGGMSREGGSTLWYAGIRQMILFLGLVDQTQPGGPGSSEIHMSEMDTSPSRSVAPSIDGIALLRLVLLGSGGGLLSWLSGMLSSVSMLLLL